MKTVVPSVTQAFAIMRVLADGHARTLSEVVQACAISPSSCLGLLRTLVGEGVLHLTAGKRYSLSPSWAEMLRTERDDATRLVARAMPLLREAAREWAAPIGLWRVAARDRLQLVALGESVASTRIHMEEGQRQPIGGGAIGRALAAAQGIPDEELARRFAAIRWQRPVSLEDYVAQVAEAATLGYATDNGLAFAGIASVAVSIPGTPPAFCLSASVFEGSLTEGRVADLATTLTTLAAAIVDDPADVVSSGRFPL